MFCHMGAIKGSPPGKDLQARNRMLLFSQSPVPLMSQAPCGLFGVEGAGVEQTQPPF